MKFPPSSLFPDFRVRTLTVTVGTSSGIILPADPNRFSFWPWGRSVSQWVIGPAPQITTGTGARIDFNSPPTVFTFADFGPIIGGDWWGISPAGPFTANITEVVYNPRRDG